MPVMAMSFPSLGHTLESSWFLRPDRDFPVAFRHLDHTTAGVTREYLCSVMEGQSKEPWTQKGATLRARVCESVRLCLAWLGERETRAAAVRGVRAGRVKH
ncbi:hypothetical protein FALCPG4_000505 [Fusarium falciforme]